MRYGAVTAVDGVSFEAAPGEVTALLGPNGAGKTTTVETAEGYRRPDGGTVRVLGLDPVADHAALTPRIGVMPQDGGVYPGIKVLEALRLFASYYDDPLEPVGLLDRVGMGLAGVLATSLADARQRQADADYEQSLRNQTAAGRAMAAVTRQRAALQASVDEAAALREQVARLQQALAASRAETATARQETAQMHRRALRAEGLVLRAARSA